MSTSSDMSRRGAARAGRYRVALALCALAPVTACADTESAGPGGAVDPGATTATITTDVPVTTVPAGQPTDAPTISAAGAQAARVVEVIDGDTIDVRLGSGAEETIRLIGINAPESGECLADEATAALRRLVLDRPLRLRTDTSDRDRYGRLLRYVFVGDTSVNAELVESGLAVSRAYEPDTGRQDELDAAQRRARSDERGQWAPDACGPSSEAPVRIESVRADAPGDDNDNPNGEWVEVANQGDRSVDLSGWGLRDESASHRYTFPGGFELPPRAQVRVLTGCGADSPTELHWCEQASAVWNNSGDTAFLSDPSGNTVDALSY